MKFKHKKGLLFSIVSFALLSVASLSFFSKPSSSSVSADTISDSWDLTSANSDFTANNCENYFSQPYGMKKANAYIQNKNLSIFSSSSVSSITVGVKCLQNGGTTSRLTIQLVNSSGTLLGTGVVVTPDNYNAANKTTFKYATFTSSADLTNANGFRVTCTTYGKNILINGASYELTTSGSVAVPSISIDANATNKSIQVGSIFTYSAIKSNADSASIVWSSSDTSVATINSSTGVATGVAFGTTTITATITVGGVDYSDSTTLNVKYAQPAAINATIADILNDSSALDYSKEYMVTGIIDGWGNYGTDENKNKYGSFKLTDSSGSIIVYNSTYTSSAISWDADNNVFTYTAKNNFIETAWTNELTLGSEVTMTSLRYVHNDEMFLKTVITSKTVNSLESISATPIITEYTQGDSIQAADFSVVGTYTVAGEQAISSSDCTVSPSILNTAGDAIEVTITYQGKSDTYNVKVNAAVHDLTDLIIVESDFTLLSTDAPKQLTLIFEPSNTTEAIAWESSNTSVATVSNSGLVTYVAPGTATITAKGEKNVCSDSITVTCRRGAVVSAEYTDALDLESTGVTSNSYTEFSNISLNSPAKFSGKIIAATKPNLGSIQLNKFKGAIWTSSSGGLIKSISVDFMNANSGTLSVYGSNDAYISLVTENIPSGTVLGSLTANGTINVSGSFEYIYIFTSGAMYVNSMSFVWDSSKYASISELDELDDFMSGFLYMDDYHDNLGYCADTEHAYYSFAKEYFNDCLTADERAYFLNDSVNTQYAAAKARLMKWAEINGDELDSTDNTLGMRNSMNQLSNASNTAIALAIAMISVLSLTAVLYLRKKKLLSI